MFTENDNLKSQYYKAIIVSDDIYPQSIQKLESLGIKVFSSHENLSVSKPLSKHADMQIVKISDKTYICAPECYEYYKKIFKNFSCNLICGNTYLSSNYPCDIAYNIVVGEKYAVHNFKYTDITVKENLNKKTLINVSQGYCACNICALPNDSFISADAGVIKALSEYDVSFLQISQGNILLPGFDYGFFGGASFMIGNNTLAINGNIHTHPDFNAITEFCTKQNINVISLSTDKIMDIGSAIFIA